MDSLRNLEEIFDTVTKLLDKAAHQIRDNQFNTDKNLSKIGHAIANISEIRVQIYQIRPDLMPDYLKS